MESSEATDSESKNESYTFEEKFAHGFLTLAFPFLIGFITWGIITLAYYQWLVY